MLAAWNLEIFYMVHYWSADFGTFLQALALASHWLKYIASYITGKAVKRLFPYQPTFELGLPVLIHV
jgi:hypothetical protein